VLTHAHKVRHRRTQQDDPTKEEESEEEEEEKEKGTIESTLRRVQEREREQKNVFRLTEQRNCVCSQGYYYMEDEREEAYRTNQPNS